MRYVGYNPITTPGGVAGSKAVKRRAEVRFVRVRLVPLDPLPGEALKINASLESAVPLNDPIEGDSRETPASATVL